jgi:hypothetical protein
MWAKKIEHISHTSKQNSGSKYPKPNVKNYQLCFGSCFGLNVQADGKSLPVPSSLYPSYFVPEGLFANGEQKTLKGTVAPD